ncbi:hypothetical protein F3Y22_tig00109919pilonHSYRG00044 [Hibiscus syriacus]|uniref:Reverse transcriptase domain-containing protein n=1 Tax=Hibiscus syriacus TaxID=106335 RepID=A0A6A3BXB4_HIBSY|nr:hypothetical protein F3Y22_tig00109919pilonHSYRG00044 [Hibiscus syriacus]
MHLLIAKTVNSKKIEGIDCLVPGISFLHLQFADDTILFLRPGVFSMSNMKCVLRCCEVCSSLKINFKKSSLIGINVGTDRVEGLAKLCGCDIGSLPFKYLGIPLGADPRLLASWAPIIDRFAQKLTGWKSRTLTFAGRVVLVSSVMSVLPLNYMSTFVVPKSVLAKIDQIRKNSLRDFSNGSRKIARVNWGVICKPKKFGGAGVLNLNVKNKALLAKWIWRFNSEQAVLWRKMIVAKYGESE